MKRIFGIFVTLMLCMAMMMPAFATTVGGGVVNAKPTANTGTVEKGFDYSAPDNPADIFGIPSVSVEDVTERLNNKGNDIVNILQTVGRWICIGAFVISVVMMVAGCVGNKKWIMQGLIGLIISGVAYAGIVCGREIVMFIASWAAS